MVKRVIAIVDQARRRLVPPYRVTAVFDGKDNDSSNDRAVFGTIEVG